MPKRAAVSSAQRPNFARGRALRRIVLGAVVLALVVVGVGASLKTRPRTLSEAWTALQRQTPAGAWTALQRHASEAWAFVRHYMPLDEPLPPPPHGAIRDAPPAHAAHRRTHTPAPPAKGNAVAKRSKDEMSRAGSTP